MMAVMTAIATLLAARFLLLLSVLGGFVLAYQAMQNPDILRIAVFVAYAAGVILPVVWLYLKEKSDVQADEAR